MTPRLVDALSELVEALAEAVRTEAAAVPAAPDRLLSVDEASAMLALGRSVIYQEIAAGRLRSMKIGRSRRIPAEAIGAYIRAVAS